MQTSDIGTSHSVSKFQKKCNFVKARTRSILQRLIKSTFNYFFLFLKFLINRPPSSIFLKNYVDISLFEVILRRARTLFILHYFFHFFPLCVRRERRTDKMLHKLMITVKIVLQKTNHVKKL